MSFSELIELAREVEETRVEEKDGTHKQPISSRKYEIRSRCKYCKNFGHTVEKCRSLKKKHEGNPIA